MESLRDIAIELVTDTAELIRDRRAELGDLRDYTMTKSSAVDPVTVVDTAAEEFLAERIAQARPEDGLIGEEGTQQASASGISWVVDPIDGTVNFIYGIPHYAVSVAAALDGEPVAGAVINVATGELWAAAKDAGATVTRDDKTHPLRVNEVDELGRALVATGFGYTASRRAEQARIIAGLLPSIRDIRRLGSAAIDLCHLAEGRVDAYFEHGLNCWDFAAGVVIAREAGAVVEHPPLSVSGEEGNVIVAGAHGVQEQLSDQLKQVGGYAPVGR
ncbi:inositol monophosphatase family protein [Corynebacterium yudongzhengii]|nr:inositol monophosphatase family protein [Corynebacterium yudongzhengii]